MHRQELRLVSRYHCSRLTSPVAMSTVSFSSITPCLTPEKHPRKAPPESPTHPGYSLTVPPRSRYADSQSPPLFSTLAASGSPSSSPANPPSNNSGHPSGQVPLQLLTANPGQGAGDGGGMGRVVPYKNPAALSAPASASWRRGQCGPWWSDRTLSLSKGQQGQTENGLKRMSDPSGPPGIRHLLQTTEQRFRRLHITTLPHLTSLSL